MNEPFFLIIKGIIRGASNKQMMKILHFLRTEKKEKEVGFYKLLITLFSFNYVLCLFLNTFIFHQFHFQYCRIKKPRRCGRGFV
jgi:hypothetical protein